MTDQGAFAGTRPMTWPRAAVGAVVLLGLMTVLLVVVPNQFVTSDPSSVAKTVTIVYVAVLFGLAAWIVAAWQNRGRSAPTPVTDKVSAFGRPMREGPGFASFAGRAGPGSQRPATHAKSAVDEPVEGASAFGRPLKKGAR